MDSKTPDPHQSALAAAEQLRDDLEALAESDLPFSHDAEQILAELDQAKREQSTSQ